MKNWRSLHYYTENILHIILLKWKYVHNVFTILLTNFQSLFKVSLLFFSSWLCLFVKGEVKNLSKIDWTSLFFRMFLKWFRHLSSTKAQSLSVALWKPHSRRSKRWPSLTFWYTSVIKFEAAYVIRSLTSRCLERKQPSRVGGCPLCDVVSSFLCHTHTDGKDKLLEWPDRSCLLLYVSAHIH